MTAFNISQTGPAPFKNLPVWQVSHPIGGGAMAVWSPGGLAVFRTWGYVYRVSHGNAELPFESAPWDCFLQTALSGSQCV